MWLYDALALFRNVRLHRMLGKRALLEAEPMLRERGLLGGAQFYDAQCDDARLVLATARSAIHHGALVANYTAVRSLERTAGRVVGAELEDMLTGQRTVVRAGVVVNATGPWADQVRWLEDPAAKPLLQPTKGIHVVVDRERIAHREAIIFTSPIDGRILFILPWGNLSYIGTTDTDTKEAPDSATVLEEDIVYLLRSANARFPNARLGVEDVRATWAGVRPLLANRGTASKRTREHTIVHGLGGMITVAGGKLTTYPLDGKGGRRSGGSRAQIQRRPPPESRGADRRGAAAWRRGRRSRHLPQPRARARHGRRHRRAPPPALWHGIGRHLQSGRTRSRTRCAGWPPGHPAIEAEVIHAVRRELAQRVEDFLVRRMHLYYELADHGTGAAPRVAELMAEEMGWERGEDKSGGGALCRARRPSE